SATAADARHDRMARVRTMCPIRTSPCDRSRSNRYRRRTPGLVSRKRVSASTFAAAARGRAILPEMIWRKLGCAIPIMLLWCGGTGAGVCFTARTILRHLDAQSRFVPVEATVERTQVVTSRRSTRQVRVTFTYEAGGSRRTSVGPTFDTSGSGFVEHDPSQFPAGLKTPAWVDPQRPDVAVLDRRIPQDTWWSVIVLQPFIAISVGILVTMFRAPSESRLEREFLLKSAAYPWHVPEWGVLQERGSALTIHR